MYFLLWYGYILIQSSHLHFTWGWLPCRLIIWEKLWGTKRKNTFCFCSHSKNELKAYSNTVIQCFYYKMLIQLYFVFLIWERLQWPLQCYCRIDPCPWICVCVGQHDQMCVCVKCVFLSQHVQCLRVSACVLVYAAVVSLLHSMGLCSQWWRRLFRSNPPGRCYRFCLCVRVFLRACVCVTCVCVC